MINPAWDDNYRRGRYNRYPYDSIVSFVMRNFAGVEDRQGVCILDLGCGGGNNLRFVHEQGFDFRAIDGAPESVRLTKDYLGLAADDGRVVAGDFLSLPFDGAMFDAVIDRASLGCNLSGDIGRIVGEIHRVLKPGGSFFGADLCCADHPELEHGRHLGGGDHVDFTGGVFCAARQIHAFTPSEIRRLFGDYGEVVIRRIQTDDVSGDRAVPVNVSFEVTARKP